MFGKKKQQVYHVYYYEPADMTIVKLAVEFLREYEAIGFTRMANEKDGELRVYFYKSVEKS